jgi:uncharacterized protein YdeI (YjbR/CyaY-like superfamily)
MENVKFFAKPEDLRQWFEKNYEQEKELWVGYYKKSSGLESIDWSQSVDQALCFGWIDGIRKSIDDKSYGIRFTPRNPKSNWSEVNLEKMDNLIKSGLMTDAGLVVFNKRDKNASHNKGEIKIPEEYELQIKKNSKAYEFFQKLAPSYKKATINWLMSAKKEETKLKRLNVIIESSAQGQKVPLLRIGEKSAKK